MPKNISKVGIELTDMSKNGESPQQTQKRLTKDNLKKLDNWLKNIFDSHEQLKPNEKPLYEEFNNFINKYLIRSNDFNEEELKKFKEKFPYQVLKEIVGPLDVTTYISRFIRDLV